MNAMVRLAWSAAVMLAGVDAAPADQKPVPAFPGAEGFGAVASGGRGGQVVIVESTADDPKNPAPGTLRHALERVTGPRIIVFRTGGIITIANPLQITDGNVTIAGQTAPGDGICFRGGPLMIRADNVIVRGLRIRPGDGPGVKPTSRDALDVQVAKNVIIDHCSMSWGVDENVSVNGWTGKPEHGVTENVTVQWCIIAEGLANSIHPEGNHSAGLLVYGQKTNRVSIHHNLFAHNHIRNPLLQGKILVEVVNNVMYNGTQFTAMNPMKGHLVDPTIGETRIHVIGNTYIPGPDSRDAAPITVNHAGAENNALFFIDGNIAEGERWAKLVNKPGGLAREPAFAPATKAEPAAAARARVLASAGAPAPQRDAVDTRIVSEVLAGKGMQIDTVEQVGGYPTYAAGEAPADADRDGMPDEWERARGLDPARPNADGRDLSPDYDNIEVYINSLIPQAP